MENRFVYKCEKCRHEITLMMGVGSVRPSPPKIEAVLGGVSYGDNAEAFLRKHPYAILDATLEIYQCRCGNIQNEYHIILRADNVKSFSNRLRCNKCGSVMRMLTVPPAKVPCPKCGSDIPLAFAEEILWD